jgi:hypothetical protein
MRSGRRHTEGIIQCDGREKSLVNVCYGINWMQEKKGSEDDYYFVRLAVMIRIHRWSIKIEVQNWILKHQIIIK